MGKKYKNPPVVEALCEFQFISDKEWDLTLPGLIYEKVKGNFPEKKQQIGIGVQFRPTEKGFEHKVGPAPPRIQFHKEDKTALIQVAPDLLVVNQLKPYPTWDKFKAMILKNFKTYKEITQLRGLKKIELKYINILEFDKKIELKDYFQFYPFVPRNLPQLQDSFLDRVEFPDENGKERLILTLASVVPKKPDILSILLDLDYVMATPEYVSLDNVSEWLEKAHEKIEVAFEASITNRTRERFNKE